MCMIRLYNTLSRKLEDFQPIHAGEARVYACGPTVYGFAHIGNLRAFLFADLLRQALKEEGLSVTFIMNITDVGHLVGDGDEGEDKMIVAMKREGKSAWDVASFYADAFFRDLDRVRIERADQYPRATEHIPEQIAMVEAIEKNEMAYRTQDGIYFDTSKLASYGQLSKQKAEEKLAGARIEMGEKRNATDFALWKFSGEDEGKRDMEWPSPWGVGFPGWHIECSAMAKKYLGVPFDIHTGGVDHIAVHHENELAQTEGADGVLEANVWMHSEFLTVEGGKMSKSLGNLYTLDDLEAKGFEPLALRFLYLGAHYRSKINFSFEALEGAQNALNKLRVAARNLPLDPETEPDESAMVGFRAAMNDDLNTPQALSILWGVVGSHEIAPETKAATLLAFDRVLRLGLSEEIGKQEEIPLDITLLLEERAAARVAKDFGASDRLRDAIKALGWNVEDGAEGQKVIKI